MNHPTTPSAAELLAHGQALRAIIRPLIHDHHQVDDLVQESYLATLRGKPPRDNLGAWMRGVARKLSYRFVRGEERRRRHDSVAARPEAHADEQSHLLSQIAAAVHRLREPQRTAIVMRYWQGLPPRVISRELGVPVNTVRSRLQTGLQELRRGLDRSHGSRGAWVGPLMLLGPERTSAGSVAIIGGLAACGVVAGILAILPSSFADDPVPPLVADANKAAAVDATATVDHDRDTPPAVDRTEVDPTVVDGQCVAYGTLRPLPSCRVRIVTEAAGKKQRGRWIACDAKGHFRLPHAIRERTRVRLEVAGAGRATVLVDLMQGGRTKALGQIPLPRGIVVRGTVRDEAGSTISGLRLRLERRWGNLLAADARYPVPEGWESYESFLYSGQTSTGFGFQPVAIGFVRTDRRGDFTLSESWLGPTAGGAQLGQFGEGQSGKGQWKIENLERCKFVSLRQSDQGDATRLEIVLRRPVDLPRIAGTLTTAGGEPVAGAKIVATSRDWSKVVCHTDERGRFELVKSKGMDQADHVTLAMPPIVGRGYTTIDPGRNFTWGDPSVRLRAKAPVALTLSTADQSLDLREYELECTTFVDEDCEVGAHFRASRSEPATKNSGRFVVAQGIAHLVLVGPKDASLYLGLHRIGREPLRIDVARHIVEFRIQGHDPKRRTTLDLCADFTGAVAGTDTPFLREAMELLTEAPVRLPGLSSDRFVVELGCAPGRCRARFSSTGRADVLLPRVPGGRPVVVSFADRR